MRSSPTQHIRFFALALMVLALLPGMAAASAGTDIGAFHADCDFSHRLSDDPIVFPGQPGVSHSHDFFGARTTDAFSTPESIRAGATSCVRTDTPNYDTDRSAYWVPTLTDNAGVPRSASILGAYYTSGRRELTQIRPFPAGLKVIAGTSTGGPSEVNGQRVFYWTCPGGFAATGSATVAPTCKTPRLDLEIRFPDCWNGVDLDSANHKSHMTYSPNTGVCPASHPVLVPRLKLGFRYPTTGGPNTRLASGAMNTAHADFMNGWEQETLAGLVNDCLVADKYCGGSDGPVPGK